MNLRKRLSILLTVCMIISSIPFTAFAEEPEIVQVQEEVIVENATESEEYSEATISEIILEAQAEDGMKVTLKADKDAFEATENLTLEATVVDADVAEEASKELADDTDIDHVAKRVTYDIKVMHDGEEIQPVDGKKVNVEFTMVDIPSGADSVNVYHHNEETDSIEIIVDEAPVNEDDGATSETVGDTTSEAKNTKTADVVDEEDIPEDAEIIDDVTVKGETGSFSLYTVDFTYEEKTVSIAGDTNHNKLSDILSDINITEEIEDAKAYQDVECTVPALDGIVRNKTGDALFKVYKENDEWYVDAVNAFSTEHGILVETKNAEYRIKVTDATPVAVIEGSSTQFDSVQEAVNTIGSGTSASDVKRGTISMIGNSKENVIIGAFTNITLDINGWVLQGKGDDTVITTNGVLKIIDSNEGNQSHKFNVGSDGLWTLGDDPSKSIVTVSGGCITGGKKTGNAGGIYNQNAAATLTIEGGNIVGNTASVGGGIYGSNIVISGGTICGNKAEKGGGIYGPAQVEGGSISYNIAAAQGGGIHNNGTANLNGGTLSNNKAQYGGGIYNGIGSSVNINGVIELKGNKAEKDGGAIYNAASATLNGGIISNNEAENGGGIYNDDLLSLKGNVLITANTASAQGGGVYIGEHASGCFVEGTKITMADGSEKNIEDVQNGEMVRTFDHETGLISSQQVCYKYEGEGTGYAAVLHFEDGNTLGIVGCHGLLEKEANKYVNVSYENAEGYIGHSFYNADSAQWEKLISVSYPQEAYHYYALYSVKHLNCIANHMLSITDDAIFRLNTFDLDENLKIDPKKKQEDINEYGLYSYEEFCENYPDYCTYVSEEGFNSFNNQYVKVAVGKGLVTFDELIKVLDKSYKESCKQCYLSLSPMIQMIQVVVPIIQMVQTPVLTLSGGSISTGLTVEEKVIIKNNKGGAAENNVFISDDKVIGIGTTGLSSDSTIGVTTETKPTKDSPINITEDNSVDYSSHFFSDSSQYETYNKDNNEVALRIKEKQDPYVPYTNPSHSSSTSYTQGWTQSGNNWQYVKADGTFARNEWLQIEVNGVKKWYHFGDDTMMDTGWLLDKDGSWYYLSKENDQNVGVMQTGWMTDPYDGHRYYLDPVTGKMLIGWHVIDGKRYYFNEHVPSASGWTQDEKGNWVYSKQSVIPLGAMIKK